MTLVYTEKYLFSGVVFIFIFTLLLSLPWIETRAEQSISITDCADFTAINDGGLGGSYVLDIDGDTLDCSASGNSIMVGGGGSAAFTGIFDGNSKTVVVDISVNNIGGAGAGLFRLVEGGTIRNVTVSGSVSGGGNTYNVGAISGRAHSGSVFENIVVKASVYSAAGTVGGVVGILEASTASNIKSSGSISSDGSVAGGLIGNLGQDSTVINSYASGNVTGQGDWVGGLVGFLGGTITNSYAIGLVTGNNPERTGGLVGGLAGSGQREAINSFWDMETTDKETSISGEGKTTDQMKDIATYTTELGEDAWDFEEVWGMDGVTNEGYPVLRTLESLEPSPTPTLTPTPSPTPTSTPIPAKNSKEVTLSKDVPLRDINKYFRLVFGRTPSFDEWRYWEERRKAKPQVASFIGAMQYQKAEHKDSPKYSFTQLQKTTVLPSVNTLYRLVYGVSPTFQQWQPWANRVVIEERVTIPSLFGAMQWQRLFRP